MVCTYIAITAIVKQAKPVPQEKYLYYSKTSYLNPAFLILRSFDCLSARSGGTVATRTPVSGKLLALLAYSVISGAQIFLYMPGFGGACKKLTCYGEWRSRIRITCVQTFINVYYRVMKVVFTQ